MDKFSRWHDLSQTLWNVRSCCQTAVLNYVTLDMVKVCSRYCMCVRKILHLKMHQRGIWRKWLQLSVDLSVSPIYIRNIFIASKYAWVMEDELLEFLLKFGWLNHFWATVKQRTFYLWGPYLLKSWRPSCLILNNVSFCVHELHLLYKCNIPL